MLLFIKISEGFSLSHSRRTYVTTDTLLHIQEFWRSLVGLDNLPMCIAQIKFCTWPSWIIRFFTKASQHRFCFIHIHQSCATINKILIDIWFWSTPRSTDACMTMQVRIVTSKPHQKSITVYGCECLGCEYMYICYFAHKQSMGLTVLHRQKSTVSLISFTIKEVWPTMGFRRWLLS